MPEKFILNNIQISNKWEKLNIYNIYIIILLCNLLSTQITDTLTFFKTQYCKIGIIIHSIKILNCQKKTRVLC